MNSNTTLISSNINLFTQANGNVKSNFRCAERIIEVIVSGKESYFSHTFSNTKAKKLWFNSACSCAVKNKGAAHKQYRSHPSAETYALYISARNIMPNLFSNLLKTLSSLEKMSKSFQF